MAATKAVTNTKKKIVQTTGDFMLADMSVGQSVEAHRPSLVSDSAFIKARLNAGDLEVVDANPPEDMTDKDVEKNWKAGKYKTAKKPVTPPEAGTALGLDPEEQGPDESDDAYIQRLDNIKTAKETAKTGGVKEPKK